MKASHECGCSRDLRSTGQSAHDIEADTRYDEAALELGQPDAPRDWEKVASGVCSAHRIGHRLIVPCETPLQRGTCRDEPEAVNDAAEV